MASSNNPLSDDDDPELMMAVPVETDEGEPTVPQLHDQEEAALFDMMIGDNIVNYQNPISSGTLDRRFT